MATDVSSIIVSSYSKACEAFDSFAPAFVISVLSEHEGAPPEFPGLSDHQRLILRGDCSASEECAKRCQALIDIAARWDRSAPLLVHCHQGVARSMAAAYILLCALEPETPECDIARRLRKAAPHADPNLLFIAQADKLLGRNDRMVEAILDLCPCAGADCDEIVSLPVGA